RDALEQAVLAPPQGALEVRFDADCGCRIGPQAAAGQRRFDRGREPRKEEGCADPPRRLFEPDEAEDGRGVDPGHAAEIEEQVLRCLRAGGEAVLNASPQTIRRSEEKE